MNKIKSQKMGDFLNALGSPSATPGGGAVAALTGAFAASLVEMVTNITIGKKGYEKVAKDIKVLRDKAIKLKRELLVLADEDVKAFGQVIVAYKSKDKNKIKKALLYAMEVPAQTAELSKEIGKLAIRISKIGNKNAYSDARSALHLSRASLNCANENIKINKKALAKLKSGKVH